MITGSLRSFIDSDSAKVVAIGFGGVVLSLVREFQRIRDAAYFCIRQERTAALCNGPEGTLDSMAEKLAAELCQPAVVEWTAPVVRGDN